MLGRTSRPDWSTHGFLTKSLCDSFSFRNDILSKSAQSHHSHHRWSSLAFDGKYLYLFHVNTLYKIGSGYNGTKKGKLVLSRRLSNKADVQYMGWIGCIAGYLYFQTNNWTKNELIKLDCETLKEVGRAMLDIHTWGPSAGATDGENLVLITSASDDSFTLRVFKHSTAAVPGNNGTGSTSTSSPSSSSYLMPLVHKCPLKLAHRSLIVYGGLGNSMFDTEEPWSNEKSAEYATVNLGNEEDTAQIVVGREFAVIRTTKGKVYFNGRGSNLGLKHDTGVSLGKWAEFPVFKSPKIAQIACGHESSHLLLVTEDGSVYFSGLAKRGEDGEQVGRRQPKPVRPKKFSRLMDKKVIYAACNYGTSALITKQGELFMFGKDASLRPLRSQQLNYQHWLS